MGYSTDVMGAALDRYITGNYGEDQYRGEEEAERTFDVTCGVCPLYGGCSWDPDKSLDDWLSCPWVKYYIERENIETAKADEAYYQAHMERCLQDGVCPECGERLLVSCDALHCPECALTFEGYGRGRK